MSGAVLVLLARFPWPRERTVTTSRIAPGRAIAPRLLKALDRDQGYAYVTLAAGESPESATEALRSVVADATVTVLEPLSELAGASAGADAPLHYVVETDVLAEQEQDFNAWYEREHLPGLAAVDGTVRAMRYRERDGHPRYHACYDLVRAETVGSPAWLAVRGTPWSARVRPAFFNTRRTMFRRV